jgi:hypothetical protein
MAEGYSDALRKFEEEMHGRIYANGKAKLRVREAKLYTCSINRSGRDEFLADMYGLQNIFQNNNKLPFKWGLFRKLIIFFSRVFGVKDVPFISPSPMFGKSRDNVGIAYNAHFLVLGEVKDYVDKNGVEQV